MQRVNFCRHCGGLLENQWIHCPWCGIETSSTRGISWESLVDESLKRTEDEFMKGRIGLLEDISGRLDVLELELDAFLAGKI